MRKPPASVHESLRVLHDEVDRETARLAVRHRERLRCRRGCADCCVDGITVFRVEADRIRRNHADLLRDGVAHAPGACAFLDAEGACRIYENRPYVCRTQGLPLRWLEDGPGGDPVEYRDICPLNETDVPIESLDVADCWTIGPAESRLARLAQTPDRIPLRSLFEKGPGPFSRKRGQTL